MGDLGAKYGFYGEDPGFGGAGEVRKGAEQGSLGFRGFGWHPA